MNALALPVAVTGTGGSLGVGALIQSSQPGVNDQDKLWIQTDPGTNRPRALKVFWNGNWRRVPNGMMGEMKYYSGNPAIDFDTTGRGNVGGEWDGWALANGNNGTADLSDKFIVTAHMTPGGGGYTTGWLTNVGAGLSGWTMVPSGGAPGTLIVTNQLPQIDIVNNAREYQANAGNTPMHLYGGSSWTGPAHNRVDSFSCGDPDGFNPCPTQQLFPTLPPFYAFALAQWIGY